MINNLISKIENKNILVSKSKFLFVKLKMYKYIYIKKKRLLFYTKNIKIDES